MRPNTHAVCKAVLCAAVSGSLIPGSVPALGAEAIDLRSGGARQLEGMGYTVDFSTANPTGLGPGALGSLYRLQGRGAGGLQEGFNANSDAGVRLMPSVDSVVKRSVDITLGDIGVIEDPSSRSLGSAVFALDLNESGWSVAPAAGAGKGAATGAGKSAVSLDTFQIWVADSPIADASSYRSLSGHARLVFDMDFDMASLSTVDRSILLEDHHKGGDSPELFVHIPKQLFDAAGGTAASYVYVYSKFGAQAGFEADAGFEEWSYLRSGYVPPVFTVPTAVPEGSTWLGGLALMGLCGGALWLRRKHAAPVPAAA